jgi:predicted phage terminase large subunit-like protein
MSFTVTQDGLFDASPDGIRRAAAILRATVPQERLQAWANSLSSRPGSTQEFAEKFRGFRIKTTPWFHVLWYAAFDDPTISRLYVQGPREHAKTSCALTYALRALCENHHLRVGIISGSDPLAMKFLNELKHEFEANEEIRATYNGGADWKGDKWTDHELVLSDARDGPDGIAGKDVSVFSMGRGSQISSRHCDLLIIDDVESAESVKSDLVRQSTREWWAREVAPVLSPGGKMIVVGTRKHFDDLYSYLISGGLGQTDVTWTILDQAKSVYTESGEPIWPEMWSAPALEARKAELDATDLLAWPQEYLNEPRAASTQMFYPEKWPVYQRAPWGLSILQFWDLAISEKTTADYTVGFCIGVDESNGVYLLEQRRGHWDFNKTLYEIADMGNRWSSAAASGTLVAIGIEKVAYQAAAIQEAMRRTMLPIVPVEPDKDKVTRARLLEARAAAGKVYRPAEATWWLPFAAEALYFPDGAHDDQIDSLAGAVRLAGWQADSIGWQYGVWKCKKDGHMFVWSPGRACPKCGTKAPEAFDDPELTGMGAMGTVASSAGTGPATAPTTRIDVLFDNIEMGVPIADLRPGDLPLLQDLAARYIDGKQIVKAQIALSEAAKAVAMSSNGIH